MIFGLYKIICATAKWIDLNIFSVNEEKSLEYIDGLVQERRNSIADALELRLSCTNPSRCCKQLYIQYHVPLCGKCGLTYRRVSEGNL